MKAQERVDLYHTAGDTLPLLMVLFVDNGGTKTPVADADTVVMRIAATSVVVINGVAKGDGSGSFAFPADALPTTARKYNYSAEVTFAATGKTGTLARGQLVIAARIA